MTTAKELIPFEQAKLEAETRKLQAEALAAEKYLRRAEISSLQAEHDWARARSSDYSNRIYTFLGAVNHTSVVECQQTLGIWHRMYPGQPIEIVFHSPGGSVFDGMALWDYIQSLRPDHHITTRCRGVAASMAGILLQAGDHRVMGRQSQVLIHEVANVTMGKLSEIEDSVAVMKKISDRIIDIFVQRTGGKLTARTIRTKWAKTDWWLSAEECLEYNLVDEVAG